MGTWQFWLLWAMLFLNVSAGIMIISQASPMAQQMVGMTPSPPPAWWGDLHLQWPRTRLLGLGLRPHRTRAGLLPALPDPGGDLLRPAAHPRLDAVQPVFAVIGLCYGGGFGTMPSFTADFFGPKYMGGIYGIILLAWGAAAIPSPIMIARLHQATGRFDTSIYVVAMVMA